jgi:hypothetical protein
MASYSEKLRDPRWLRRRREILQRAQGLCEECFVEGAALQVHHKSYRRGAEPWEYADDDLIALCGGCHADRHEIERIIKEASGHAELDDSMRIRLALMVLGFCATSSKASEDRCVDLSRQISEAAEASYWFICGFTAAKGDPRMREPIYLDQSELARWIRQSLAKSEQ